MSAPSESPSLAWRILGHRAFPLGAALIAAALALPSVRTGLQSDDHWHRAALTSPPALATVFEPGGPLFRLADGNPERTRRLMNLGLRPWWTGETFRFWFWRPVTEWTHRLDYLLWPGNPALMHLQNILWYAGWVLCAALLYRQLIPAAGVAGLATLLFAMDYAHALPACWLAARSTLVCTLLGTACLIFHDAWRRRRSPGWAAASALALGLAFLSKESAIGACAYLLAYAAVLDTGRIRSRIWTLAPCGLVAAAWHIAYRIGGYGVSGSGMYVDPANDPLGLLRSVCFRAPILLLGQWGMPPAETLWLLGPAGGIALWIAAVAVAAGLFYLLAPILRSDPVARFFFAGMLLATAPACTGMVSSRQLEYVGLGAAGLLALLLQSLLARLRSANAGERWAARIALPALLMIHLIASPVTFVMTHYHFSKALAAQDAALTRPALMGPELAGRSVVLLNPPGASYAAYLNIHRALAGHGLPAHVWALAPGRNAQQPVRVTRVDATSLKVHAPDGVPVDLDRGGANRLRIGDRIALDGLTVTVEDIGRDGFPTTMVFTFAGTLESGSLAWFRAQGAELAPWTPPAPGDPAVTLP